MYISIYLTLSLVWWLILVPECMPYTIVTRQYKSHFTLKNDLIAFQSLNASLLECAVLCSKLNSQCSRNREQELSTHGSSGRCRQAGECVGFQFTSGTCVPYKREQGLVKTIMKTRYIEIYLASGFVRRGFQDDTSAKLASAASTAASSFSLRVPSKIMEKTPPIRPTKLTKHTATFGSRCSVNHQCDYEHGLCLAERCSCIIGHSFNFTSNKCVTRCARYGRKYSLYKNSGIQECNKRVHYFVQTKERCFEKCIKEKAYVCINSEYLFTDVVTTKCYHCDKTWAEVNESARENGTSSFTFMYRHCA